VLFLFRPFEPDTFYSFVGKLEAELRHPIRLYYFADQQSGDYLNDRKGWKLLKRDSILKNHGCFIAHSPQRYSVWTYTPDE